MLDLPTERSKVSEVSPLSNPFPAIVIIVECTHHTGAMVKAPRNCRLMTTESKA